MADEPRDKAHGTSSAVIGFYTFLYYLTMLLDISPPVRLQVAA
jgi:hypothetical protein